VRRLHAAAKDGSASTSECSCPYNKQLMDDLLIDVIAVHITQIFSPADRLPMINPFISRSSKKRCTDRVYFKFVGNELKILSS